MSFTPWEARSRGVAVGEKIAGALDRFRLLVRRACERRTNATPDLT